MGVSPNIDDRGAGFRLFGGVVLCAFSPLPGVLAFMKPGGPHWWMLGVAAALLALGAFMVYEGKKNWCGVKACAIKLKKKP